MLNEFDDVIRYGEESIYASAVAHYGKGTVLARCDVPIHKLSVCLTIYIVCLITKFKGIKIFRLKNEAEFLVCQSFEYKNRFQFFIDFLPRQFVTDIVVTVNDL